MADFRPRSWELSEWASSSSSSALRRHTAADDDYEDWLRCQEKAVKPVFCFTDAQSWYSVLLHDSLQALKLYGLMILTFLFLFKFRSLLPIPRVCNNSNNNNNEVCTLYNMTRSQVVKVINKQVSKI